MRGLRTQTAHALFVLCSFCPGILAGQEHDHTSRAQLDRIDSYVAARLERGRIPGAALAIVHGDSILHMRPCKTG